MSMYCNQCQETARNQSCTVKGVCGKTDQIANLQDLLIYNLKGLSQLVLQQKNRTNEIDKDIREIIIDSLFTTITNANFDQNFFIRRIKKILKLKKSLLNENQSENLSDEALWLAASDNDIVSKAGQIINQNQTDADVKSLQELLIYGIKGIAAYYHHAFVLGYEDKSIVDFIIKGLDATIIRQDVDADLLNLVLECGEFGVKTMALLDKANTETYGNPEPTDVSTAVGTNPGILVSGHDLKDLQELLEQTQNSGVDVYTHGEMLPAHYYPELKKYKNLKGNYGGSWWQQKQEFTRFNGPILMTTNCLVPPQPAYADRLYTTGTAGFDNIKYIENRKNNASKDFSGIIEKAKNCQPPEQLEFGTISGGFAHHTVLSLAEKVITEIQQGNIKKFIVMAGCDGRQKSREYYTEFAENLPQDTIILTAGCAKYRYNKLNLGNINGIPRILDAGQCNDSYSLAVIALKLAEVLKTDVNDLPISYNIAWYEQKAVIVLLALLSLGVKNIHLGPTLPAFLSPGVAKVLVEKFNIAGIGNVDEDVKKMTA